MGMLSLDSLADHWEDAAYGRLFHDFGNGEVRAHRHLNPDGSLGGWVADSAYVSPDATVEDGALVYEQAQVLKKARLLKGAKIRGDAIVGGNLIIGLNVIFENYATCKIPPQVRHPIYIGHDALHVRLLGTVVKFARC